MARIVTISRLSRKSRALTLRRSPRGVSEIDDRVRDGDARGDVESQVDGGRHAPRRVEGGVGRSRLLRAPNSAPDRSAAEPPSANKLSVTGSYSPHGVGILLKIFNAIMTDLDDETLQREDTEWILIAITLLKEAIVGVVAAFLLISLVLLVDHIFALRLPTARNFRRAAFHLMEDPTTLKIFEESSGLKLVDITSYETMHQEMSRAANKTEMATKILEIRTQDGKNLDAEVAGFTSQLDGMRRQLGFDKFDEAGLFHGHKTHSCQWKVDFLRQERDMSVLEAIIEVMKPRSDGSRSCVKTPNEMKASEQRKEMVGRINEALKHWDEKEKNFNADGHWDGDTSCMHRANYLSSKFGYPWDNAEAIAMVETNQCHTTFDRTKPGAKVVFDRFDPFCAGCFWGWSEGGKWGYVEGEAMMCNQRVAYLTNIEKIDMEEAKLKAMRETRSCVVKISGDKGMVTLHQSPLNSWTWGRPDEEYIQEHGARFGAAMDELEGNEVGSNAWYRRTYGREPPPEGWGEDKVSEQIREHGGKIAREGFDHDEKHGLAGYKSRHREGFDHYEKHGLAGGYNSRGRGNLSHDDSKQGLRPDNPTRLHADQDVRGHGKDGRGRAEHPLARKEAYERQQGRDGARTPVREGNGHDNGFGQPQELLEAGFKGEHKDRADQRQRSRPNENRRKAGVRTSRRPLAR